MREIKFRVPMFKITTGRFSHFSYWGRIDTNGKSVTDNSCFCSPAQNNLTFPGEDEQFTGLHDKSGREIYEGDIVRSMVNDCSNCLEESVCNSDNCPKIEDMRDVVTLERFRYWTEHESFGYEGEDLVSPDECEVIGNIHENPELAKECL